MKSFFYFQSITAVRNQNVGKPSNMTFGLHWFMLLVGKRIILQINIFYQNKKSSLKLDFNCC